MKRLFLLFTVSLLSSAASAQMEGNTKQECTRRCLSADLDDSKRFALAAYNEKLKQIRAKKEAETDPAKRKELEESEKDQLDRRDEDQENFCRKICAPLRDE